MKHTRLVLLARVTLLLLVLASMHPASADASSGVSKYYGEYEIYEIRKIGGGVTSDEWASKWKGSTVSIRPKVFQIRDDRLERPYYMIEKVRIEGAEGNVISSDLSIFFGIGKERSEVKRILVFEKHSEKYPYQRVEILNNDTLLDIFDGRAYFFRRKPRN
ncbi:MAG: hypothetical protein HYU78_14055 [Rhodocyclales bacterium]|nr:hypothetical protein [Rhodocyclales bacterium]